VTSLDLAQAKAALNVVCGLGGAEVTPATLRWALEQTRSTGARGTIPEPVYVPEGV
jgi:hypothetical protein